MIYEHGSLPDQRPQPTAVAQDYLEELPEFLLQLVRMINNPDVQHIVKWSDDGLKVMITDKRRFEAEVLGEYFDSHKFESFQR